MTFVTAVIAVLVAAVIVNVECFLSISGIQKPCNHHGFLVGDSRLVRFAVEETKSNENNTEIDFEAWFPKESTHDLKVLNFHLKEHRPLGCTIEESLAQEETTPVFVSKVKEGGAAEKVGIEVGDVFVGVTGFFGNRTSVLGYGVEKVKAFISSVPGDQPLEIQVVRGSNVLDRHERALVDLCAVDGASENEIDQCVLDFLVYDFADEEDDENDNDKNNCVNDDDEVECMIENMHSIWAEELPPPSTTTGITNQPVPVTKKVKPWSRRSSPSGTYVRDPVTRQMRNIDPV